MAVPVTLLGRASSSCALRRNAEGQVLLRAKSHAFSMILEEDDYGCVVAEIDDYDLALHEKSRPGSSTESTRASTASTRASTASSASARVRRARFVDEALRFVYVFDAHFPCFPKHAVLEGSWRFW